ncbi:hypothetical protein BJ742DRAFT_803547 [Cladochytrium replicatum]|nr:hypothetical protein BJ742DRAFT_803547 [Cladochytrium replicatum]
MKAVRQARNHRALLLGMAGVFAGMGVWRAFIIESIGMDVFGVLSSSFLYFTCSLLRKNRTGADCQELSVHRHHDCCCLQKR